MPRTINEFFGAAKDSKKTPARVTNEDNGPASKKAKTDDEFSTSAYFKRASAKDKSAAKKEPTVVNLTAESPPKATRKATTKTKAPGRETTPVDLTEELATADRKPAVKKREELSNEDNNASPKKRAAAKRAAPSKAKVPESNEKTAEDVLAGIPDAELPDVDPSKKFNYFAAKRDADAMDTSGSSVSLPPARENCFAGMTFVFTGVMPSLGRDDAENFVKRHGGKVTSAPSGKTSVIVIGDDAGPKKIQKVRDLKLKAIDEGGFLQLIREMPADGGSGDKAKKALERQKDDQLKAEQDAKSLAANFQPPKPRAPPKGSGPKKQPTRTRQKKSVTNEDLLWTSKYAPKEMSEILGNSGPIKRLDTWLQHWSKNLKSGFKAGGADGSEFRAALLHGPPGIGKTTAAHLVAELQGYDVIENNASDTRSKGLLQSEVTNTLANTSLAGFLSLNEKATAQDRQQKPLCIVMDEVDGMSAGDRGGIGAMAALARTTKVPLILIANERSLPKMRPFDRVCYDIPFRRPDANAIRKRLAAIALVEGIKLDPAAVDQLVQSTRGDIRQILNLLSTYARTVSSMSSDQGNTFSKSWQKEIILKPFDIVARFLSPATWNRTGPSLNEKIELYFNDYEFAPLMVQENYLNTVPRLSSTTKGGALALAADAANAISEGDLVDRLIHGSQQQWSLMPFHAMMSCVLPSYYVAGQGRGRFNFSAWLGNNSKAGKYRRLLAEVQSHMRLRLWAAAHELRLDYQPELTDQFIDPLVNKGIDGIPDVINVLDTYFLTKEDYDTLLEVGVGAESSEARAKKIPTNVKSAFTRKYNGMSHPLPFMKAADAKAAPRRAAAAVPDLEDVVRDDMEPEPEPEVEESLDAQVENDKYIQKKKPKAVKKAATKPKAAAKPKAKAAK